MEEFAPRRKDGWSPEQDRIILELRGKGLPWKHVAEATGRTAEACCCRYRALVPKGSRPRYLSLRRWTDAEEETLAQMVADKKPVKEIALSLGRTTSMVNSKVYYEDRPCRRIHLEVIPRVHVPPERVEDRDRRNAAERDLTAQFFGDPPRGWSALDKKQGAFA